MLKVTFIVPIIHTSCRPSSGIMFRLNRLLLALHLTITDATNLRIPFYCLCTVVISVVNDARIIWLIFHLFTIHTKLHSFIFVCLISQFKRYHQHHHHFHPCQCGMSSFLVLIKPLFIHNGNDDGRDVIGSKVANYHGWSTFVTLMVRWSRMNGSGGNNE